MVTEKKKVKLLTNEVSQKKLFQLIESKGKVKSIHPF